MAKDFEKKVCLNTAFWLNSQWNYFYERICGEFSKLFSVLCKQMATKSFLTYFNEQCIYRISVVKNILIIKRLKGLLFSYVKLSIFFTDCWTANAYLTFSWTKAKLWREAICDVVSHISFTFWKALNSVVLTHFCAMQCYSLLLSQTFITPSQLVSNARHALLTFSEERQLILCVVSASFYIMMSHSKDTIYGKVKAA